MDQLTQKLKSGDMTVQEVPLPVLGPRQVLVQIHYSLISAGTEGSTVNAARKSLVGKAKERPDQARQVLEVLRKQGPVQTYRAVMKKLDAYSPLGYSAAGVVLQVGNEVEGLAVGDKVGCAAHHAEVVAVSANLCTKLDPEADLKFASYNTLGAIALQGVRQADLRLGEKCAVIGLGLLGQLTCQLLRASGVGVVGIDVAASAVQTAAEHSADLALERNAPGVEEAIQNFTHGLGVDAVIITAGTSSLDPVNFAGAITRKKGVVVIVGAVPTGFDRNPHYYPKELDLRMSCSYGPGRYDLQYEEKAIDYPAAYVRWTEQRNMQAFQELLHDGALQMDPLTTHTFPFTDAPKAYDMIVEKSEAFLGIVLEYDTSNVVVRQPVSTETTEVSTSPEIQIAFIGAGSYAQGSLLPNLPKNDASVSLVSVMTNSGVTSKRVAERFGFNECTSEASGILENKDVNTVFIATRHDSHAAYALQALQAGKHVFVEKPLALKVEELEAIDAAYREAGRHLMIGFNRRYAPYAMALKKRMGDGPKAMLYRVNAGAIPADTWIQDREIGGGRMIGEGCHFIDFMTFLCDAVPVDVYANALPDPQGLNDIVVVNLRFADGSVGAIHYYANGSKAFGKEYIEVHAGGATGILDDFKRLEFGGAKKEVMKTALPDKGQAGMLNAFLDAVRSGGDGPVPYDQLRAVSLASIAVETSIKEQAPVRVH